MPPDPLILAFDTSGPACEVAVLAGARVLAHRHETMARGQAERLMPMIDDALTAAGVTAGQLGVVACGTGPGNFTGIRIAVAAARGLALALGVPAVGVGRGEAAALHGAGPGLILEAAPRNQLLAARSDRPTGFALLAPEALAGALAGVAWVAGSAAHAAPPHLPRHDHGHPQSVAIGLVALAGGGVRPPAPLYVRPPDAAPAADPPPAILP